MLGKDLNQSYRKLLKTYIYADDFFSLGYIYLNEIGGETIPAHRVDYEHQNYYILTETGTQIYLENYGIVMPDYQEVITTSPNIVYLGYNYGFKINSYSENSFIRIEYEYSGIM